MNIMLQVLKKNKKLWGFKRLNIKYYNLIKKICSKIMCYDFTNADILII